MSDELVEFAGVEYAPHIEVGTFRRSMARVKHYDEIDLSGNFFEDLLRTSGGGSPDIVVAAMLERVDRFLTRVGALPGKQGQIIRDQFMGMNSGGNNVGGMISGMRQDIRANTVTETDKSWVKLTGSAIDTMEPIVKSIEEGKLDVSNPVSVDRQIDKVSSQKTLETVGWVAGGAAALSLGIWGLTKIF